MASHKLSTGSTGENDVFETLTPAETSESSDPNERPRIEANGVSIDKEMLAVEEKDTTQKVNGVKEQSEGSDFFDDQGQNDREHALKQASEVASNIKDLRDRVTLLEESLAKGHGTKETKSDVNKDDATSKPSFKELLYYMPTEKWSHRKYAARRSSSVLSISVRRSTRSPDVLRVNSQGEIMNQGQGEMTNQGQGDINTDEFGITTPLKPKDTNQPMEEIPDRLEINSDLLRQDLSTAAGIGWGDARVLLRPFKPLVLYEQEIRRFLENREKDYKDLVDKAKAELETNAQSPSGTIHKPSACAGEIASPLAKPSTAEAVIVDEVAEKASGAGTALADTTLAGMALVDTARADAASAEAPDTIPAETEPEFDEETTLTIDNARKRVDYLRLIVNFIDTDLKDIQTLRHQISNSTLRKIAFDDLWHLFNPGDLIIASDQGHYHAYRVLHVSGGRPAFATDGYLDVGDDDDRKPASESQRNWTRSNFSIDCFSICFDGEEIEAMPQQIPIKEFGGERAITDLAVFPLKFVKDEAVRKSLVKRGKRFKEVASVAHQRYTGLTKGTPPEEVMQTLSSAEQAVTPNGLTLILMKQIDSEVIVDFATSFKYNKSWVPEINWEKVPTTADSRETAEIVRWSSDGHTWFTNVYDDHVVDRRRFNAIMDQNPHRMMTPMSLDDERLTEEHYELLPRTVNAYSLRNRCWYILDLDLLKDVDSDEADSEENCFNDLVIPSEYKDLVEALVKNHSRGTRPTSGEAEKEHQVDLVKGKGKGIIILLHGVPGVGKTSTAECVAAYTKRPLYPITCGDIGDTAEKVERNLEHHFRLAHQWGCILLLDEADVFLAKRSGENITRNGLVSVFLRVLEYYAGILFLTTNRVGSFDEAFRSRIHLSLYYPPLSKESTTKIWTMNLDRLEKSGRLAFNRKKIMDFADKQFQRGTRWNGRQIRNAFQTAISLAEYDQTKKLVLNPSDVPAKPKLTKDHFKKVAKASAEFDDYVKDVMGGRDYAEQAAIEEVRRDSFGIDSSPSQPKIRVMRGPISTPSKAGLSVNGDSDDEAKESRRDKERKMRRDKGREKEKMGSAKRGKGSAAAVSSSDDSGASD